MMDSRDFADDATSDRPKAGRPRIDIDEDRVRQLALNGNLDTDIAIIVGCSVDTLARRCQDILNKARAELRMGLREAQVKCALKGDRQMLIWLGKQYLDQSDRTINDTTFEPIEIIIGPPAPQNRISAAGAIPLLDQHEEA